ncbi:MAG: hypothetical protein QXZ02_06490 [Candidatus Bathyarchaeia archaeon]
MKALIASIVFLIILLFKIIEVIDYFSLNIKLVQDLQPAIKGDYTNATENIAKTLTDYTIDYAHSVLITAIIGAIIGIVLCAVGIKRK